MAIFSKDFNFDSDLGVVQTDGDGGDRPARTGLYHYITHLLKALSNTFFTNLPNQGLRDFSSYLNHSQDPYGKLFRSPQDKDPQNISRDQLWAIISAMGAYGLNGMINQIAKDALKNFNRAPNGDFLGPAFWCHLLRAKSSWFLWPLFILGDLELLLGSLAIVFVNSRTPGPLQSWLGAHVHWIFIMGERPSTEGQPREPYGPDSTGNDINHTTALLQALYCPTPLSWLARLLYRLLRPEGVQYAWDRYFDPQYKGNPFNELARPLLTRYFNPKF